MKTDDLIAMLAADGGAVEKHVVVRRHSVAMGMGLSAAAIMMLALLGVRPDLSEAIRAPMFWIKLGYVACLLAASLRAVLLLSRPGARLDWVASTLAAPVLVIGLLAALALADTEPAQRLGLLLGATWKVCPLLIAMLSFPTFIATLWAMREFGPTRPKLAGAAAGLLSGTVGALVYCLHCPEMEAPFFGLWYLLGILIPGAAGAMLGNRLLHW